MENRLVFGVVAETARSALGRALWPIGILCAIGLGVLYLDGDPAAAAFALIAVSSLAALYLWSKMGRGLPMFALLAAQNLVVYGLPIVAGNETVTRYPADYLTKAGWEVFACNVAMIALWRLGMIVIRPATSLCYALLGLETVSPRLTRLGITLLGLSSTYLLLEALDELGPFLSMLPAGSNSIINAVTAAVSACGFFLCGMMVGRRQVTPVQRTIFWTLLVFQCLTSAQGFLLSSALLVVFASAIGLFWGSGRFPWRYITSVALAVGFLNLGKFTMREKYWSTEEGDVATPTTLVDMPSVYREWAGASIDAIMGNTVVDAKHDAFERLGSAEDKKAEGQSLLERINNLENLTYVIDAVESKHIKPLDGATYTLIPPLLIPRVIYGPNKPRSHEGQVLLNVHFGRQDLNSTFRTYIAWGLLPEAYGNFGPITGAILLGAFLGFTFAAIEQFSARKLVLSMEGFLCFTLFLGVANSYEMVSSVLVTSLFQAFVPIIVACSPFVERVKPTRIAQQQAASADDSSPLPNLPYT